MNAKLCAARYARRIDELGVTPRGAVDKPLRGDVPSHRPAARSRFRTARRDFESPGIKEPNPA